MTTFTMKAPWVINLLRKDFPKLGLEDAFAILGNLGLECRGFDDLVEIDAKVGGEGGFGWPQWTGPRRREFEAYCERNGLNRYSDKANYGFLWVELHGSEKHAIDKVVAAGPTLRDKVVAFELAFERAGKKNYDARLEWAERAKIAWEAQPHMQPPKEVSPPVVTSPPTVEKPPVPNKPPVSPPPVAPSTEVEVPVVSAWWSKINIVAVLTALISLAAALGFVVPPEWREVVLQIGAIGSPVLITILRTWFTRSVTPSVAKKL